MARITEAGNHMSFSDYLPHAAVSALGLVTAWVAKDHFKRDDTRFAYMSTAVNKLSDKLDAAMDRQAANHAEVLKLLIK
jgi:hypothetical protein